MATLPQLIEDDIQELNGALQDLLYKSDANNALIIDKGGFIITHCDNGNGVELDAVTLAALSAASYAATEGIANLVKEKNFSSVYQQGETFSILVHNVDEFCLLAVIFKAQISVGAVKYFAAETIKEVAKQLKVAKKRNPKSGFDLSELNMADPSPLFMRKSA
jgi:predicted regulator of Ras-like GTPase activity (Roadblock/LC7/MglB family)